MKRFPRHFALLLALVLSACSLLSSLGVSAAEPTTDYDTIRRLSKDLYNSLEKQKRGRLLSTPLMQEGAAPSLQPGSYADGTNSWEAVYFSKGLVDFLNNLAYAKGVEREDRTAFVRFMAQLSNGSNAVPEVRPLSRMVSFDTLNHQISRFNQMAGGLIAVEMAHHYLGHYKKYGSLLRAGQPPAPINSLLTPEEWEQAMLKGARNALDCGLSVEGLKAVLEIFDNQEPQPTWAIQFLPPGANIAKVRKALTQMERDFFVMDNK
jgi:hypothetical protein